jgi:hypothetical protein
MNKKICVFILTHGRPKKQYTIKALKDAGFVGDVFLVIDDEDKTKDQYLDAYGKSVLIFNKLEESKKTEECDNFTNRGVILYARNKCFDFALSMGYDYFLQLDDDYTGFSHISKINGEPSKKPLKIFNKILNSLMSFIECNEKIKTICFLQDGDTPVGIKRYDLWEHYPFIKRKAMNSFLCKTDRKFKFIGRLNEDVNTYTLLGGLGDLFFSTNLIMLHQKQTQKNTGGMTDIYIDGGTYVKSFYSVIVRPDCVTCGYKPSLGRMHHKINWDKCVPKIISEEKKIGTGALK